MHRDRLILLLSVLFLFVLCPSGFAQPEEDPAPPNKPIDSILEDLYGDQDEANRACQAPCEKQLHTLIPVGPHPANPARPFYIMNFRGIYLTPITPGTVNGLDVSGRIRIPDNPTIPKEVREDIEWRKDAFTRESHWMSYGDCQDACQCVPLLDPKGNMRPDPNKPPVAGMHEVLLHGGTVEENGKKYIRQFIFKAYTIKQTFLGECRAGYRGPRLF